MVRDLRRTEDYVTPVLSRAEVPGISRTASVTGRTPTDARSGGDDEALRDWGFDPADARLSAFLRR